MIKRSDLTQAFLIASLPPIWATLAPHWSIQVGAVSLIVSALYVMSDNHLSSALPLTLGLLLGDVWAWLSIKLLSLTILPHDLELFLILAIQGGLAVILSVPIRMWLSCPALLCGWAIGLTVLTPLKTSLVNEYCFQIGIAMVIGIWYIGVLLNLLQVKLDQLLSKHN